MATGGGGMHAGGVHGWGACMPRGNVCPGVCVCAWGMYLAKGACMPPQSDTMRSNWMKISSFEKI